MAIKKEAYLENLNGDLKREYSACIQYVEHAAKVDGVYWTTREELNKHAEEELAHAMKLSDRIVYLGGTPVMSVGERKTSEDPKEMIQQDIKGEQEAITRYKQRIQEALELKDEGTAMILRDILEDEEEHEDDLLRFIGEKKSIVGESLGK
jgi:bacterioferritin